MKPTRRPQRAVRDDWTNWLQKQGIIAVLFAGLLTIIYMISKPALAKTTDALVSYLASNEETTKANVATTKELVKSQDAANNLSEELVRAQERTNDVLQELVAVSKETKTEIRALDATTRVAGTDNSDGRRDAVEKLERTILDSRDAILHALAELKGK